MPKRIENLKIDIDEDLEERLQWLAPNYETYHIIKKSIDARKRHQLHFVYTLDVFLKGEQVVAPEFSLEKVSFTAQSPLIIGAGPAGLFAALRFCERGIPCKIFEQGSITEKRMKGITQYWRYGNLDPRNNVCYGEGGAGLFSDGKLITRIKSPYIPYVMNRFVKFGAPPEIEYLSNPHVGSDRVRRILPQLRQYLQTHGCEFYFDCKVSEIKFQENKTVGLITESGAFFPSEHIILATGHSAEDIFYELHQKEVAMEEKAFAIGLRIEHPQDFINQAQYRDFAHHPKLGAANYKLTYNNEKEKVGVYSFCMCPGGYVLSTGTEPQGVVCNGMSNYKRNSPFANSAIVISVSPGKNYSKDLFSGLKFRQGLERKSFEMVQSAGGRQQLPAQKTKDFLNQSLSQEIAANSCPSGLISTRLDQLLPHSMTENLSHALEKFNSSLPGFINDSSQLIAIESRTSCPLRIIRDSHTLESISHSENWPCHNKT